jgi:two-component system nitrate/nitrite response regulator NarL
MPTTVTTLHEAKRLPLNDFTLPETSRTLSSEKDAEIRVALIEDSRLVREALTEFLTRFPDTRVTAVATNGHDRVLLEFTPDVVLLDLGLENGGSLRLAREVLEDFPQARVVVMGLVPDCEELSALVHAGVSGFIMQDATLDVVLTTVRSVAAGLKVLPDQMTATFFSQISREDWSNVGLEGDDAAHMTPREREVVHLVAEGLSNKAIGKRLGISTHTVKSHLHNIMKKLSLHSRLQVAAYVHRHDTAVSEVGTRAVH